MQDIDQKKGMLYMLIASFCFALTGACARYLSSGFSPVQLVLFRNVIGVIFILHSIRKNPVSQPGGNLSLLIFRGVIGTLALYTFFYGISKIGLAISINYQQSYPVFLAIFAAIYMGEKLLTREWLAIIAGFAGICLIFLPNADVSLLTMRNHLIGISNAVMTGLAYLSIRGLSRLYDDRSIILSFMLSGIILPLISLALGNFYTDSSMDFLIGRWVMPHWWQLPVILLLGIAALLGQIYLTKAFSHQKTGVIAAIGYTNIVFSVIFGTLLGDAFPGFFASIGIMLIIVCGILISWHNKKTTDLSMAD